MAKEYVIFSNQRFGVHRKRKLDFQYWEFNPWLIPRSPQASWWEEY